MHRRALVFALLLSFGAHAQQPVLVFADGRAGVRLPDGMVVASNERKTIVATFGPTNDHKLELTLHEELRALDAADAAEQFIADQARKKGRRLQSMPGKAVFLEPGGELSISGKAYRILHFQVGFAKSFVVATITAPYPATTAMKDFLGTPLNDMIASFREQ